MWEIIEDEFHFPQGLGFHNSIKASVPEAEVQQLVSAESNTVVQPFPVPYS